MILLILQTRTHPIMRAENIDPKQGRLEPQKGHLSLEKMKVFAIKVRNSIGHDIRMIFGAISPNSWMATMGC